MKPHFYWKSPHYGYRAFRTIPHNLCSCEMSEWPEMDQWAKSTAWWAVACVGGKPCTRVLRLSPRACRNALHCAISLVTGRKYWIHDYDFRTGVSSACAGESFHVIGSYRCPVEHFSFEVDRSLAQTAKTVQAGTFNFQCAGEAYEARISAGDTMVEATRRFQAALLTKARSRVPGAYRETVFANGEAEVGRRMHETIESRLRAQRKAWQLALNYGRGAHFDSFQAPSMRDSIQPKLDRTKALMADLETRGRADLVGIKQVNAAATSKAFFDIGREMRRRTDIYAQAKAAANQESIRMLDSYTAAQAQAEHAAWAMMARDEAVDKVAKALGAKVTRIDDEVIIEADFSAVERRILEDAIKQGVTPLANAYRRPPPPTTSESPRIKDPHRYQGATGGRISSPAKPLVPGETCTLNPVPMWVDHKTRSYEPAYDGRHDAQVWWYNRMKPIEITKRMKGSTPGTVDIHATVRCAEPLQQVTYKVSLAEDVEVKVEVF